MSVAKTFHGGRAKVQILDNTPGSVNEGKPVTVGIFSSISFSVQYGAQPLWILGRHSPAEIVYTHAEPVQMQMSGWRQVGFGPHAAGGVPRLQELMAHDGVTITVTDRATDAVIATITNVRPTGYSTTVVNRQLTEMSMTAIGELLQDETTQNAEPPNASVLP